MPLSGVTRVTICFRSFSPSIDKVHHDPASAHAQALLCFD
jgi:hypothetical protein